MDAADGAVHQASQPPPPSETLLDVEWLANTPGVETKEELYNL